MTPVQAIELDRRLAMQQDYIERVMARARLRGYDHCDPLMQALRSVASAYRILRERLKEEMKD